MIRNASVVINQMYKSRGKNKLLEEGVPNRQPCLKYKEIRKITHERPEHFTFLIKLF